VQRYQILVVHIGNRKTTCAISVQMSPQINRIRVHNLFRKPSSLKPSAYRKSGQVLQIQFPEGRRSSLVNLQEGVFDILVVDNFM